MTGFDVIGDVHGCADLLEGLLGELNYREGNGAYRYVGAGGDRQAVFVGDLIDRGSQQIKTLEVVRSMVDAGSARIVMGNHEFNAISFATPNPEVPGEFMRRHTAKNRKQHKAFTDQVPTSSNPYREWIDWFKTLPLWLELGGIRIVHACWNAEEIARVSQWVPPGKPMTTEFVVRANRKGSPEYRAIEVLLKGPELSLTEYGQPGFVDKDNHLRDHARIRWWNAAGETLRDLAEIPPGSFTEDHDPYPELPELNCPKETVFEYIDQKPVFYGHYWRTGEPLEDQDWTDNSVCVDFSAVKDGPLVAYRWDEGSKISFRNYVLHTGSRA
jgi:hypothetical protein